MAVMNGADVDLSVMTMETGTVTASQTAIVGATTVYVNALTMNIPTGTVLVFTGANNVTLTADAVEGALSLSVAALGTQVTSGNTASTVEAWSDINDMNTFSKSSARETNKYPVLMKSTPYAFTGLRDQTYDMGGYLNPADAGQAHILFAHRANAIVTIKVEFDGSNGFTQAIKVSNASYDVTPEGLQEVSFELTADGDPTIVGTGPNM